MIYSPNKHNPKEILQSLEDQIKAKEKEFHNKKAPSFSQKMRDLVSGEIHNLSKLYPQLGRIVEEGKKAADKVVTKTQQEVKRDPWGFLGKTALIGLGIGLVLGHYLKHLKSGEAK